MSTIYKIFLGIAVFGLFFGAIFLSKRSSEAPALLQMMPTSAAQIQDDPSFFTIPTSIPSSPLPTATAELAPVIPHALIRVAQPTPYQVIKSPVKISGTARGFWFFEASFPIQLFDANGKLLAEGIAKAQGNWMTENFVPFSVSIKFPTPKTATGTLVFKRDNPSGLAENDDQFVLPVRFVP